MLQQFCKSCDRSVSTHCTLNCSKRRCALTRGRGRCQMWSLLEPNGLSLRVASFVTYLQTTCRQRSCLPCGVFTANCVTEPRPVGFVDASTSPLTVLYNITNKKAAPTQGNRARPLQLSIDMVCRLNKTNNCLYTRVILFVLFCLLLSMVILLMYATKNESHFEVIQFLVKPNKQRDGYSTFNLCAGEWWVFWTSNEMLIVILTY